MRFLVAISLCLAACSGSSKPAPTPPGDPNPDPAPAAGPCFKGGCSAQLCSDQEGMNSTCEFRPEYACYGSATCERQADGACGWTQTPELTECLANPPAAE